MEDTSIVRRDIVRVEEETFLYYIQIAVLAKLLILPMRICAHIS